jgi:hypothetical protein
MKSPRPDKTMDQIFTEFLADPETRALYQSYLKRNWPDHWRQEYGRTFPRDGAFGSPFRAEDLIGGSSGDPDDLLAREFAADPGTMKVAGAVLPGLGIAWPAAKGDMGCDDSTRERAYRAARDLLATQDLLGLLRAWLAESSSADDIDDIEDHFLIHRIEPRQIWLESMVAGEVWGPIDVPVSIARACRVGWEIGGVVVQNRKGWRLIKVGNVSL